MVTKDLFDYLVLFSTPCRMNYFRIYLTHPTAMNHMFFDRQLYYDQ
jgi:hypothetical protein